MPLVNDQYTLTRLPVNVGVTEKQKDWVWWCKSIIPAIQVEANLGYTTYPNVSNVSKAKGAQNNCIWQNTITQEHLGGGSKKVRGSRPVSALQPVLGKVGYIRRCLKGRKKLGFAKKNKLHFISSKLDGQKNYDMYLFIELHIAKEMGRNLSIWT